MTQPPSDEHLYALVLVSKALDPNSNADFVKIVLKLQQATRGLTGPAEADALRSALSTLDVDWRSMDKGARAKVYAAAKAAVNPVDRVLPKIENKLVVSAAEIGQSARKSARASFKLKIEPNLSAVNSRVLEHVATSQALFIRNEYGRRSAKFSQQARDIVEAGLAKGARRKVIVEELQAKLGDAGVDKSKAYWNMIAATFANRARTYSNLASYADAGIAAFIYPSVMDERTSVICRFMNGRRFPVAAALEAYAATARLKDPTDVVDTQPWLSEGKNDKGDRILYFRSSDGSRSQVAVVDDGADGQLDAKGKFSSAMSNADLQDAGVMSPPLHGLCRSTIMPEYGTRRR